MASESVSPVPTPQRCGRCGYVTAGLGGTTCPECGFDLTKSAYLRFADRTWLRTIVVGIHLIHIGAMGLLVAHFGGREMVRTVCKVMDLPVPSERVVGRVMLVLFLALAAVGAWMLTASDPSFDDADEERMRHRKLGRLGIASAVVLAVTRIFCDGWLGPIACSLLTFGAMACGIAIIASTRGLVRSLVRRSETATAEALAPAKKATAWIPWVLGAVVVVSLLSMRAGLAGVAAKLESLALGIGIVVTAFILLKLLEGTKAIRDELEKVAP